MIRKRASSLAACLLLEAALIAAAPALAQPRPAVLTLAVSPDGSAAVRLPAGWTITGAFEGTVDIVGPQGQAMGLGGYNAFAGQAPDPARGLLAYMAQIQPSSRVTIRKVTPIGPLIAGGRSAYLSVDGAIDGRPYRSLASVTTADMGYAMWMIYISCAMAPAERFDQDLPLMQEIWKSWTIHPGVFRERQYQTRRSMEETYRIWRETMEYQRRVYERANDASDQVIRGDGRHSRYGERYRTWPY